MAKATKKKANKKKSQTRAPARLENPVWLSTDPVGGPPPPVTTRSAALPFLELGWENFERLCYRLAQTDGAVEKAWSYGTSGYGQLGIDVLVRMKDGSFEAWQSKRYKTFGVSALKEAINVFMDADWAKQAKRFVLAVGCAINDPRAIDEIEKARTQLQRRGIAFQPLFASELTEILKTRPEVIDDYFGRAWAEKVCAPEAVAVLADRMSRLDIASLRIQLRAFYTAWIGIVDPGLPLVGQTGGDMPAPELSQRYVVPDIILEFGVADHETLSAEPNDTPPAGEPPTQAAAPYPTGTEVRQMRSGVRSRPSERRIPVAQFLAEAARAVITADAGAGKTTLLRYLALDILSDTPALGAIAEHYAGYVPVWVPFALWARMCEGQDRPPPLEDVVQGFIEALNEPELADRMRRILRTAKFVLLVDGLDETREQSIADALIVSLTVFAEQAGVAVLATSRPHGMKALSGIGGTWRRARLAPLSEQQRSLLALLWYRILERHELGTMTTSEAVERQAKGRANNFSKALLASPGIARLAQTPLFLLSLLKLHRLGRDLPRNRFDASKEIVEQLVSHQPKRRAKDAMKTESTQRMRQRDRLLEDFAFGLHSGEFRGNVTDGANEADAISRGVKLIMTRTGRTDISDAEDEARTVFSFSEEVAGLLVKKTQDHVGFLHRSLQEYFAGSHLAQFALLERVAFIKSHAAQSVWKEPILYLLFLSRNEQEVGLLLDAIGEAPTNDAAERTVRDALLTEAAFADFAHDIPKVQQLVQRFFAEAELYAWGTRQRAIIAATVDGLFSQSVASPCADKLAEWIPDYHGYGRGGAILAMRKWNKTLHPACIPLMIRVIASDYETASRSAGSVLAEFARGDAEVKKTLVRLAHQPRSIDTLHGALFALGQGWGADADIGALATELRHAPLPGIQMDAIRIRVSRGDADLSDLDIFADLAFDQDRSFWPNAPDLVEYFAYRHKTELLAHVERAVESSARRRIEIPLVGTLIIAEPAHRLVEPLLRRILAERWSLDALFERSKIPLDRVTWTSELVRLVEENLTTERHRDYEYYWISKVLKLPSLKHRMIESMKAGEGLTFWSSLGLAEVWGRDDAEVRAAFTAMLDAPPKAFAEAADDVAAVLDDRMAVREAILRALRQNPRDARFLLAALRRLGIGAEDDEAFMASYEAGDPKGHFRNDHHWRGAMIVTFAARPQVRDMAQAELAMRDGNLAAVSDAYAADYEMCKEIMKVIAPLPDAARLSLVPELETAAPSSPVALKLLAASRYDTDGATAGQAVMAWSDTCMARNAFGKHERDFLADELQALGSEFQHRRAAAAVGLIASGNIEIFADLKDHQGKPEDINIGRLSALDESDRYLKRMLPHWAYVTRALGGEENALARFGLSPQGTLAVLNPGSHAAEQLFRLLEARAVAQQTPLHERISAMRRFAPDSDGMRRLIEPLLLRRGSTQGLFLSNSDLWPSMMAADIFAEHFARSDLRQAVIDVFVADPTSDCAAAAVAEMVLREGDTALESLLRETTEGVSYELVTSLRVTAALGNLVGALEWLLKKVPENRLRWNCSYWVPAFLRRIERDERAADEIIGALGDAPSASAQLSELTLLGLGCKDKAKTRPILNEALQKYEAAPAPVIAFDVTAGAHRLATHALSDLLA